MVLQILNSQNYYTVKGKILIKSRFEFYTEMNSFKNSSTMKRCTALIEKKKAQIQFAVYISYRYQ